MYAQLYIYIYDILRDELREEGIEVVFEKIARAGAEQKGQGCVCV